MKTCDICNSSLKFFKFRYAEGNVCKRCYGIASRNYTETICGKSYTEISEICKHDEQMAMMEEEFEVSNRIGNFILFDKKNQKFCLPNNLKISKTYKKPEIYSYGDMKGYDLICSPTITLSELYELQNNKKSEQVIKSMKILIYLKSDKETKDIHMIPTPVRIKSFAFKRSFAFTKRIMIELQNLKSDCLK